MRAVVLLDEPYGHLDPPGFRLVDGLLESLRAQGRTVLMATHLLARGREHCDRALLLESGRLVFAGPSAELPGRRPARRAEGAAVSARPVTGMHGSCSSSCARTCCCSGASGRRASPSWPSAARPCCSSASPSGPDSQALRQQAAGFLWLGLLLASTLSLAESFEREMEDRALEGVLLLPASPRAVFYAKALANWIRLALVGVALVPGMVVLYDAGTLRLVALLGVILLGHGRAVRPRHPLLGHDRPGAGPPDPAAPAALPPRGAACSSPRSRPPRCSSSAIPWGSSRAWIAAALSPST